jgi:hypothetical protein
VATQSCVFTFCSLGYKWPGQLCALASGGVTVSGRIGVSLWRTNIYEASMWAVPFVVALTMVSCWRVARCSGAEFIRWRWSHPWDHSGNQAGDFFGYNLSFWPPVILPIPPSS